MQTKTIQALAVNLFGLAVLGAGLWQGWLFVSQVWQSDPVLLVFIATLCLPALSQGRP